MVLDDYTLSEEEDISYNMSVNSKQYEAVFYQKPDTVALNNQVNKEISKKYTKEQLEDSSPEIQQEIKKDKASLYFQKISKVLSMKSVWFRISEYQGEYFISMYYDNGYNKANGEDL